MILTIPIQILEHIFKYLDNYLDIINFHRCNKFLYDLFKENSNIKKHTDKVYHKCFIDLRQELTKELDNAEEFASRMEEMYNEPMEYKTTYCEVIDMFVENLFNQGKKDESRHKDKVIGLVISPSFQEYWYNSSCSTFKKNWENYLKLFPHAKIILYE